MAVYLANKPYNIAQIIIEYMTKEGEIVLDPFLGSGVTIVEALRLKRKAVGVDINPYSILITQASLKKCKTNRYLGLVDKVIRKTEAKINSLYLTRCDNCERDQAVIVKTEFTEGKPDYVRYYCQFCGGIEYRQRDQEKPKIVTRNPANKFDSRSSKIADSTKLRISQEARRIAETRLVQNGRLNLRKGEHIYDLFSKRNLLATSLLYDAIWGLKKTPEAELVRFTFLSGIHLMKYTDYKSNSQATYYRPKERLVERNVLEVFLDRIKLVLDGRAEYDAELEGKCREARNIQQLGKRKGTYLLELGSTKNLKNVFPENGPYVDFVLTDPPYSDQVQYLDYCQLWNVYAGVKVDWSEEIVISNSPERPEKQGDEQYGSDMAAAFSEVGRVMKPGKYACVYFHDLKLKYLNVLIKAMKDAGFAYVDQIHIEDDVPTFKVANNPAGTLAGHVLIFFVKLEKSQQPLVISGVNIDELIVATAQRIIADHDGSATTPQLMDEGITKVLYENDVLDELVRKYDTVVPILKKYLDYNEQGGLWSIKKSDIDEGRLSATIPVKSRLRVYIPSIVNRLHKEQGEFSLNDVVNKGLYPLIKDEKTPVDEGDIVDILKRFAMLTEDGTKWRKKLPDKYVEDLKIRIREILGKKGKATIEEVHEAIKGLVRNKAIPYDITKQDTQDVLQKNFIYLKKGAKYTADLTGYLGLPRPGLIGDEELTRRLKKMNPKDFQSFVASMVEQMGFRSDMQKFSGDGGVDVKATLETDLGKTVYAIQVKRYDKAVSVEPVRELVGVMDDFDATNGVFVTTSHFTAPASEYAARRNVTMIDGGKLVELIKKYQLFGVKAGKQSSIGEFILGASGIIFIITGLKG
jgi:DNA modification methylase